MYVCIRAYCVRIYRLPNTVCSMMGIPNTRLMGIPSVRMYAITTKSIHSSQYKLHSALFRAKEAREGEGERDKGRVREREKEMKTEV